MFFFFNLDRGDETEHKNGMISTGQLNSPNESAQDAVTNTEPEKISAYIPNISSTTHKLSKPDHLAIGDYSTKEHLLNQYSKSEMCLTSSDRQQLEDVNCQRQRKLENEQNLNEQVPCLAARLIGNSDDIHRSVELSSNEQRSNNSK